MFTHNRANAIIAIPKHDRLTAHRASAASSTCNHNTTETTAATAAAAATAVTHTQFVNFATSLQAENHAHPTYPNYDYYSPAAATPSEAFLPGPRVTVSPYGSTSTSSYNLPPASVGYNNGYPTPNVVGSVAPGVPGSQPGGEMVPSASYPMHGMQGPQGYVGQMAAYNFQYSSNPNQGGYGQLIAHGYGMCSDVFRQFRIIFTQLMFVLTSGVNNYGICDCFSRRR